MLKPILFDDIKKLYDSNLYDIGYLTHEDLIQLMNFPIKMASVKLDNLQDIYNNNYFGILVIKHTKNYDYSIDQDLPLLLSQIPDLNFIAPIQYFSLKIAQVLAGTGQYGKNQVIYNYRFGFETHVGLALIKNELINLPIRNKPNWEYLPQCSNCDDCYNACPVGALHNKDKFPWVDMIKCNMFNHYGNHPIIPSIKWSYGKIICDPPIKDSILFNIQTDEDLFNTLGIKRIPNKINTLTGEKYIQYPICRECTSQPKCS